MQNLVHWLSRSDCCLLKCFKSYPNTRAIIDCTEFLVEKSKTPTCHGVNTNKEIHLKCRGWHFTFRCIYISTLRSGNVSEKELTKKFGIQISWRLDMTSWQTVDSHIVFTVQDYCTEKGCKKYPSFFQKEIRYQAGHKKKTNCLLKTSCWTWYREAKKFLFSVKGNSSKSLIHNWQCYELCSYLRPVRKASKH